MVTLLETQDLTHIELHLQQQQRARRVGLQLRKTLLALCRLFGGKASVKR